MIYIHTRCRSEIHENKSVCFACMHPFSHALCQSTSDSDCVCIAGGFSILMTFQTKSWNFWWNRSPWATNLNKYICCVLQNRTSIYFGRISTELYQPIKYIGFSVFVLCLFLSHSKKKIKVRIVLKYSKRTVLNHNQLEFLLLFQVKIPGCIMRSLWIAVVLALALIECNYGQEEDATVSEDLIDDVFNRDTKPENDDAVEGSSSSPPEDKSNAENPIVELKSSNVSRNRVNHLWLIKPSAQPKCIFKFPLLLLLFLLWFHFLVAMRNWRVYPVLPLLER